ncbi:MAG: nucleotidyltransferase domain-containing protein [Clostridiaceae bacterium]|nr:nucleotidyltransferase domain-containing protein [Clostridiaceae bacterium]
MDFDIDLWIKKYMTKLQKLFGLRLRFAGLQGSYGRGEATASSDIDVVVILDKADTADLSAYSTMLDTLPCRENICGFISGYKELISWESSDLFQFYYDTLPLLGSLDFLLPFIKKEDVYRAVSIGACNIYHTCGHNMVHEKDFEILKGLYKSAAFTVQAIYWCRTGEYIKKKSELIEMVGQPEKDILLSGMILKSQPDLNRDDFELLSGRLFNWASEVIVEYRAGAL